MIRRPPRSPLSPHTPPFRSPLPPKDRPRPQTPPLLLSHRRRRSQARRLSRTSSTFRSRSEEHTSELQSRQYLVCRLLLEKKKKNHVRVSPTRHHVHVECHGC